MDKLIKFILNRKSHRYGLYNGPFERRLIERFKEIRVIGSSEMECIRCKEIYSKEMFSVRTLL